MSADIAALGKGLIAEKAFERLASIVSSEVISEITGFLENLFTTREYTLEVLFVSEGLWLVLGIIRSVLVNKFYLINCFL